MSSTTYAPAAGGFDDFREWEVELDPSLRDPIDAPLRPQHLSRAEQNRAAEAEIAEGVAEWHRTNERRN